MRIEVHNSNSNELYPNIVRFTYRDKKHSFKSDRIDTLLNIRQKLDYIEGKFRFNVPTNEVLNLWRKEKKERKELENEYYKVQGKIDFYE